MFDIILKISPLFFIVAFGFFCKKRKFFNDNTLKYLTRFVMYLSLPAVLLEKLSTTDFETLIDVSFLFAYLSSLVGVMLISGGIGYVIFSKSMKYNVMLGLGGVYGNIGFLAIPVLSTTLGEWVSIPLALMLTLDLLILLPVATFLLQLNSADEKSNTSPLKALKRSLFNPLILSIMLGLILSIFQITLPNNIIFGLDWLGKAAGPCAMFIVGTALYGRTVNHKPISALYISTMKLIVMPFAVYFFMSLFSVNPEWIVVATLGAAMPCAAVLGVIAEEHKILSQQSSTAVLLTTIFSVLTIPLLIGFFS
jgi:predicted permease